MTYFREVPSFTTFEFAKKKHRYAICVFVINEGEAFQQQVREMQALSEKFDLIIADGGSTDNSTAHSFLEAAGVRSLLVKTGPGKLSAQMRMAFSYSLEQGYEAVITMDGNHKDDPSAAILFAAELDQGYDHLQGSRFIEGGKAVNTPLLRWLAIRLIHAPLIRLASGFQYTDTTNGFRAYSANLLNDTRISPFRNCFNTYELHYYLAVQAARLGYRVKEIPVTRSYPAKGKTPTKISPIRGNLLILKILFQIILRTYEPKL